MPNLPSSFASAAAGQNANRGGRGGPGGDWSRRDGRSANGTLTLRRSSTTPLSQPSHTPAPSDHSAQSPVVEPQTAHPLTHEVGPARYSKEELLTMASLQAASDPVSRLFMPGWNPGQVNGGGSRAWGKSNENHVPQEPGACWDDAGESAPLGLQPLSAEERDAFSTEINSPLKPPSMLKDGTNQPAAVNGRKASLSQGTNNAFSTSSPSSAARPGTRRRETADSNTLGLNSPSATGRTGRDDASPWFSRKTGGDVKEADPEEPDPGDQASRDAASRLPFGNLMRSNTGTSTGAASIWGASSNPSTPSAGAFGNFALGGGASAVGDKRAGAGAVGASRLAHLIPKDGSDAAPTRQPSEGQNPLNQASWRARTRTDTDPFAENVPSGSAALGGAQDTDEAPSQPGRGGMLGTPVKGSAGDFGLSDLNLGSQDDTDPASPSQTNPYRSPPADKPEQEDSEGAAARMFPGFAQDPHTSANPLHRGFGAPEGHDRSQTSSVSGNRGFPMGPMSAWAAPGGPTSNTPDRERSGLGGGAFSPGIFGAMGEGQGPGVGNIGGLFGGPGAAGMGAGSIGRGSKLGSLFPAAMQAQMQQSQEQGEGMTEPGADPRHTNPLGAIGRGNFAMPMRDSESPMRPNRGVFEELFPSSDASRSQGIYGTAGPGQPGGAAVPQSFTPGGGPMGFGAAAEPPAAQTRTMVMPDRMRWVYLDPQGEVQGPFTGLEMNDWYKAHFFTPDLRVKKVEDPEFEPLGQLIRRIGNSREPFLVPQVGIPHGPPSQSNGFPAPNAGGGVVPPLSGVFPSFGRTLTAEEQNNLERRKQEEQYMMAQQRDYAMRQSAMTRFQGQQPGLQHHSSAQSLQSQPSFGSMASPMGQMPQQQPMGQIPVSGGPSGGFFDPSSDDFSAHMSQSGPGNGLNLGEEVLALLPPNERQALAALQASQGAENPLDAATGADILAHLPNMEELGEDPEGFRDRLMEFQNLRSQRDAEEAAQSAQPASGPGNVPDAEVAQSVAPEATAPASQGGDGMQRDEDGSLSLTQQVQQTQAAALAAQVGEPGMPMPFPPPTSGTPLPAPTAQRARSNLPEQYSRSRTGSPRDEQAQPQPPPLAPWAKEAAGGDAHKGPSLKEIQEAEARKAAQAEEAQAAIRKAALEQEAAILREKERQASAAAAGLPATSTWGHASPVSGASPWANPAAVKAPAPGLNTGAAAAGRKTLAEIQREEENRKQKETPQTRAPGSASKSYANLAGKPGQPIIPGASPAPAPAAAPGAGWATVGAGGKVKVPTGPAAQSRSTSATGVKPPAGPAVATVVKPVSRPGPAAASANGSGSNAAMDEFRKWVQRELTRGLSVNDIADFANNLDALPLEKSIIADAIYASSNIMDGRHFAEEYVRRKTLAEKGVAEKQPAPSVESSKSSAATGGWSEVAKKSSTPTNAGDSVQGAGFKVVPGRKKGKK